jgi:hypothetical protein
MTRPPFDTLSELDLGGCRRSFGHLQGIGNLATEELLQPVKISAEEPAFCRGRVFSVFQKIEDGAIDDCPVKTADGLRAEPFVWIPDVAAPVRARQHRIQARKSPRKVCF